MSNGNAFGRRAAWFHLGIILCGLSFHPVLRAATVEIPTGDADVTLSSNENLFAGFGAPFLSARGDFNGDGFNDLAVSGSNIYLFLGGHFSRSASVQKEYDFHISRPPSSNPPLLNFSDLDGDGRDDLVVAEYTNVYVFYGREPAGESIDLTAADLILTGVSGYGFQRFPVTNGDVNGDRFGDLLIGHFRADPLGRTDAGVVYLLMGKPAHRTGTLDLSVSTDVVLVQGVSGELGTAAVLGDVNGDGRDDLILSAPKRTVLGRSEAGEIDVIFGRSEFPPVWDLAATPADVRIIGGAPSERITGVDAGDFSGDGMAEVAYKNNVSSYTHLLAGISLSSGPVVVDLLSEARTVVAMGTAFSGGIMGDFDGDGRKDLVLRNGSNASLFLSQDYPAGASLPSTISTPSVKVLPEYGNLAAVGFGDMNGDGRDDLALTESPNMYPSNFFGQHDVIYGFRPIKNPSLRLIVNGRDSPRISLELSVEGDVTEMRLSGDLDDPVRDRWIPYERTRAVDLTPGEGPRGVRATFRNAFARESETVEDTVLLSAGDSGIVDVTTVVYAHAEGQVRVDCHLASPGSIKASVFSADGERLADLMDEQKEAGVWPIRWDGRNAFGRRVVPGIYFLVIEIDGRVERRRVVVRG